MSEFRRRLISQSGELPNGYTRLKYIFSNNGASLDTNVLAPNTRWELGLKCVEILSSTQFCLNVSSYSANWFGILNSGVYSIGGGNDFTANIYEYQDIAVNFLASNIRAIIGMEVKNRGGNVDNKTVCLGAEKTGAYKSNINVYYLIGYDNNDNVLFNGIPAIDNNGNVGLFDTITQQLFQSTTGTQFIAGYE